METNVCTKSVRIFVRDLPPLHDYVRDHKDLLVDISYVVNTFSTFCCRDPIYRRSR